MFISDLRREPGFIDIVADRIWRSWWQPKGYPLAYIHGRLEENLGATPIPFALIAHHGAQFLGTVSVIASDMDERPAYSPRIAALWVDPEHRNQGIGAALVDAATRSAFAMGVERLYLCAVPGKSGYYERLGWEMLERDVAGLDVLSRQA
ncbi:GNAT family N-acetyltransferase [Rhodoligotrophos ferricapiens]|uniref:GNAT family N-acetyltransferase n=1 Tax=Rhodoligotrophos ferricapiens TaxID=3069264 RepID=UPI00315C7D00